MTGHYISDRIALSLDTNPAGSNAPGAIVEEPDGLDQLKQTTKK